MDTVRSEQLVLANNFDELKRLQQWVETLSVRMELSQKAAFQLDLVLSEAVTNIISYAYEDESDHVIVVRFIDHRVNAIVIELIDDGKPFNPLAVEIPQVSSELATVAVGGWGIQLITGFTRDQSYCYEEGKNVLKLVIAKDYEFSDSAIPS
jgi:anti-sigma regulatory factor (Ser/Thr protein kinase)